MISGIALHHGAISVSNLPRSLAFYEEVLGFTVDTRGASRDGSMEIVHLKRGSDCIELFAHKTPQALPVHAAKPSTDLSVIGVKHYAFYADDIDDAHRQFKARGVDGLTDIGEGKYYKFFYFADPDGIVFKVSHRKAV